MSVYVISFTSVLQFSKYKYFTSLVRFIPKYFILLDAIINGILFLISFFFDSLLLFRNITGFYILILSTTLNGILCFCHQGNWNSERLNNLTRITQLVSRKPGLQIQVCQASEINCFLQLLLYNIEFRHFNHNYS